jgi:hypothetical protein
MLKFFMYKRNYKELLISLMNRIYALAKIQAHVNFDKRNSTHILLNTLLWLDYRVAIP